MKRYRHQDYLHFLREIDRQTPGALDVHLICDNYSTHKHARVKAWLERHPRFDVGAKPLTDSDGLALAVPVEFAVETSLPGAEIDPPLGNEPPPRELGRP